MRFLISLIALLLFSGCSSKIGAPVNSPTLTSVNGDETNRPDPWTVDMNARERAIEEGTIEIQSDFNLSEDNWNAEAAGFPESMQERIGFFAGRTESPLGGTGFEIRGSNEPVTLFMFLHRQLTALDGIQPGRVYEVQTAVKFVSGAADDCMGAGGSPGAMGIRVGAFASGIERMQDADGTHRINHDPWVKPGEFNLVGAIDNGRECQPELKDYVHVAKVNKKKYLVKAGADGSLNVLLGISGGFIGETRLWIEHVDLVLKPQL